MSWIEFSALLANLPGESQLSNVVYIRTADGEDLKNLTPSQLKLRGKWYNWIAAQSTDADKCERSEQLQSVFKSLFYRKEG